MEYMALVKRLDPHVEEEVTVEIEGVEFTGFAFICPYEIEVGQKYPVSIGFTILDEFKVREIYENEKELERLDQGFGYCIRGLLDENSINAGIIILDEDEYFADYPDLIGKYVEMEVDRISIEFLEKGIHEEL
ncbi:hypothetical protein [Tumebacillus flagellatus]|uniref:Uncharacterized protein n=1 Tax=Tumebacillus flagellatus TaxID=1157490 RepID=A0A074MHI1_9BACL|nr:hypothetical protein [Tumebacillus flagellatus]KEO85107.1 hypothetical protein EL26_00665 [Tumebacillus flagellatus]